MTRSARFLGATLLVLAALAAPRPVHADPVIFSLQGVNDSSLTATVSFGYQATNDSSALLTLIISNTSLFFDPRLTAFAFNAPSAVTNVTSFTSSLAGWSHTYAPNGINTPGQYGSFDVAGRTGPNFNGGNPPSGIARNTSATFTFTLAGSGLTALNEMSFLSLASSGGSNTSPQPFIARFQRTGRTGGGSDVAIPTGPPTQVPEPATVVLMGAAAAGLLVRRRYGR